MDKYIEYESKRILDKVNDFVDGAILAATHTKSSRYLRKIDYSHIHDYLKKRGYSYNNVDRKLIMVNGFVCVDVDEANLRVTVWHDTGKYNKPVVMESSQWTGLPIVLNYMERI